MGEIPKACWTPIMLDSYVEIKNTPGQEKGAGQYVWCKRYKG
jgi:hypothetical protein